MNHVQRDNLSDLGVRLSDCLVRPLPQFVPDDDHHVGILVGEGVGAEIMPVTVDLLKRLADQSTRRFSVTVGGLIGETAKEKCGTSLSPEVVEFARTIFDRRGALFCGPGGDRFVYELRREFDLYCKFTPIKPCPELRESGPIRPEVVASADIVAVRENLGGVYQGRWDEIECSGEATARHFFEYRESAVRRIVDVAMRLSSRRHGRVHLALKPAGVPSISALWRRCAQERAKEVGILLFELEIDNAAFQLIANPGQFDVVLSPNMFGDVLADCGALLLASRGLSYSGNFNDDGAGVYQTGHGAARDIAGRGIANPLGQVLALGMMLRESFSWPEADRALRRAVAATLAAGYRTLDIATRGATVLGTRDFGDQLALQLDAILMAEEV